MLWCDCLYVLAPGYKKKNINLTLDLVSVFIDWEDLFIEQ